MNSPAVKILVLGAQGQLGRCLADQLAKTTYDVFLSGRAEIDLLDFAAAQAKIIGYNPDIIINASAYTAVDNAEKEPALADQINHLAVGQIARLCAKTGAFLIHVSTDYVFDGRARTPYPEGATTNPQGVYGKTKLDGEKAIQASGCKYIILRTAWVFSEYGNNFLKTMLNLGQKQDTLAIVQDQIGCPTYAQDIARAILATFPKITDESAAPGLYHYCGDAPCSWFEFAQAIFAQADKAGLKTPDTVKPIPSTDYPTPAPRPAYSALNCTKFTTAFAYPPSDWRAAIGTVVAKHRL